MSSATISIDPQMTMRELLAVYAGAQRALFRKYHIGGCSSCGFQPEETLAAVCARNENLPVEDVIAFLQTSQEEDGQMQISPAELDAALKSEDRPRLVDVRTREEFDTVHLPDSVLLSQELMQEMLTKWDREAALVMVCHHGIRSMDAAAYFAGHGFKSVKSLTGGLDAWSEQIDANVPRYHVE